MSLPSGDRLRERRAFDGLIPVMPQRQHLGPDGRLAVRQQHAAGNDHRFRVVALDDRRAQFGSCRRRHRRIGSGRGRFATRQLNVTQINRLSGSDGDFVHDDRIEILPRRGNGVEVAAGRNLVQFEPAIGIGSRRNRHRPDHVTGVAMRIHRRGGHILHANAVFIDEAAFDRRARFERDRQRAR